MICFHIGNFLLSLQHKIIIMELNPRFKVILLPDVHEYLATLTEKARNKIISNVRKATLVIDPELFKKLGDTEIWEFRTRFNGMTYRPLAFWDENQKSIVIATHGFTKKTQKTPPNEIKRA